MKKTISLFSALVIPLGDVDQIEAENCIAEEYFHTEQTFGMAFLSDYGCTL